MKQMMVIGVMLLGPLLVIGCAPQTKVVEAGSPEADIELSRGYSALHGLMEKQSKADKILLLKSESDALESVIQDIAERSTEAHEKLGAFVEADPNLELRGEDLPVIEEATRKAIEWTKTKGLLFSGGEAFQKDFILSQIQGTNYASHLAEVLAKNDPDESRTAYLNQLSSDFSGFYDRLHALLELAEVEPDGEGEGEAGADTEEEPAGTEDMAGEGTEPEGE